MIKYSGERMYEPDSSCIVYTVSYDGEETECSIDEAILVSLCDEFATPIQIFDACHMIILEYTRQRLNGEMDGVCAHIELRKPLCSEGLQETPGLDTEYPRKLDRIGLAHRAPVMLPVGDAGRRHSL